MAGKNPHTKWGGIFPLHPGGGICQYEIATPNGWHDPESLLEGGLDRCRETATMQTRKGVPLCEEHAAFVASSCEPLAVTFQKAHPEFGIQAIQVAAREAAAETGCDITVGVA